MKFDPEKRTIGLNFTKEGKAVFRLFAPQAENAAIVFGDDSVSLEKEEKGFWSAEFTGIKPGDHYLVRTGKGYSYPDPASLSQPEGVHGSSEAIDLNSFTWDDRQWMGLEEENIFYELHTGTFTPEGTFEGIAGKLDYLQELGINTIELMPVVQFPGSRNWGYDGVFPFAVHKSYGGAQMLQSLVNECHRNGIAVVLDAVYNHLGPEGNYLNEFGPYFTDNYRTPWGSAINFDGPWSDGIRQYYVENMLMWFRDFHIDGLRLDAIHAIKDFSARHLMRELRDAADELQELTGKRYILVGETDLNDVRFLNPSEKGGYSLDKQWCDEFHHALHGIVTGEKNGYYEDFGETAHLVKSFNSAYVYDGIWSEHRKRTFGSSSEGIPGNKFVVFTQNHDQIGNRLMGDRIGHSISFNKLKLIAAAMFFSPFVPLIFMGEEYGETNPFLYFTSHSDENLAEAVSKGRREEFPDFMNSGEFPEPQSEDVYLKSKLSFDKSGRSAFIFRLYKELIALKKSHPVLSGYDRTGVKAAEVGDRLIVLERNQGTHRLVALLNFSDVDISYDLDARYRTNLKLLLNTASARFGGNDNEGKPDDSRGTVPVLAESALALSDVI